MERELSNDTLVYEAVQRIYRNAVLRYLRTRLAIGRSADQLDDAVRVLFQKEWDSIVVSASQAQATGVTERAPMDALDHLSVNHFRSLFEKFWGETAPESVGATPELSKRIRKQLLVNVDDVVNLRNPVSHPPEDPLPVLDGIRCVDAARRVLKVLGLSESCAAIRPIIDELVRRAATGDGLTSELGERLEARLPPRESVVIDFVGRTDELQELWAWLLDDDSRRWMLVGDGGKGKSATAYRFAQDVRDAAPRPLTIVHWLSAKRRKFEEGEIVPINSPDFWDLESAVDWLLRNYGWGELTAETLSIKRSSLLELCSDFPSLIILDDLDSLPVDADDVSEFFLLDVCQTKSKVLATSRRTYTGMGRSKTVIKGLDGVEAAAFLESRQRLLGLEQVNLTDERLGRIVEATEGSPLYMEDLLRLARFYPIDKATDVWKTNKGDRAREYALKREIEMLSTSAREVLDVCAVAPAAATVDELARCTRLSEDEVQDAIGELHAMYLVPGPQVVEDVPRYQLNRNIGHLIRRLLRESARQDEVVNAVQAVFGKVGRASGSTTMDDVVRQARVFLRAGEWIRAQELVDASLERHPNRPELYAMKGRVLLEGPQPSSAAVREAFGRARELRCKDSSMYQAWGVLEVKNEEWNLAAVAAESGLSEAGPDDPRLLRLAGYARSRLARKLRDSFAVERAKQEAIRADGHLERAVDLASRGSVPPHEISRVFRAWVINADLLGSLDALPGRSQSLCARLQIWCTRYPHDERAKAETEYYRDRCPELA